MLPQRYALVNPESLEPTYSPLLILRQVSIHMASHTAPPTPFNPFLKDQSHNHLTRGWLVTKPITGTNRVSLRKYIAAAATQGPRSRQRAPPGVDTRIHWDNEDEGWIGGSTTSPPLEEQLEAEQKQILDKTFSDLLNSLADSHYQ